MNEDFLIQIDGRMEQDGENDKVELMTRGSFVKKGSNFFISYKESETTGYAGCTTTVKVAEGGGKVTFSYTLDSDQDVVLSRNLVTITVKRAERTPL